MGAGRQDHRPGHAPVGKKHFSEVAVDRLFLLILDGQGHIAQGKALHRAAARVSAHQGDQGSLRRDDRVARFRGDPVAVAGGAGGWIRHAAGSQDDAAAGIGPLLPLHAAKYAAFIPQKVRRPVVDDFHMKTVQAAAQGVRHVERAVGHREDPAAPLGFQRQAALLKKRHGRTAVEPGKGAV